MLGDHSGLEAFGDPADTRQVAEVEALGAAERQSDLVQRNRIVAPDRIQIGLRRPAAQVVLGRHFEPSHVRALIEHRLMVREAQPEPRLCRNRVAPFQCTGPRHHARYAQADVFPPRILPQSPAGSSTYDFGSRAFVA